ncbi:hypothetical protein C8J57DRAFT_1468148 [Mycena rebaudengoi]|nr:hypothetical protein C8J57DRAFT_1468148 [Mycena rebaudengoi]
MDPVTAVGLVASILQLVAAAKSVLDLGRDALNATKDQRDLLLEVANLAPLLEDLKHRVQQPNNQSVNGIQKLETPLGQLKETMEHINRKLGSANKVGSKALMWAVWSKKEVDADLAKIERFRAVLNAWLLLDNWDAGQQQEKNYSQIRTELGTISQNQREYQDGILTEVRNVAQNQQDFQDCKPVLTVRLEWDIKKRAAVEREKIFDWLSPPNFFARHAEIFATRQKGTGLWFLDEKQFQDWLSAPGGTLWCHGIPGAGKTVLTSIVVDHLRNELQGNNTGVAAAYLNHKESDAQSPLNVLAGLWWQLVAERPISPAVQQLYEKHQNQHTRPSLDEVRNILTAMTAEYSKLFFVVDALDEYPEAHRDILLKTLAAMGESVSLMLTSRPNLTPEAFFSTALVLEISAKDEDIRSYIKAQIQNSFRLSKHVRARPELRGEIETKIAENADGMFLIAKLHIDSLATKSTVKAVRDALQNLPEDLEHTYDEAMDRIEAQNKDDREIARRTLIWVANAKRPLTVFELQEALAIEPDSKTLDVDGLLDIEIILSVCVGLVIVDVVIVDVSEYSRIVRLVHLTIQEYLDRVQPIRFPGAQTEITRHCLAYISYNHVPLYWEQGLLSYASTYCLLHAAGEPELVLQDIIIQFLGVAPSHHDQRHFYHTAPLQWYAKWPRTPSKLWVAALFGLQHIARHLLESDESITEEEKAGSLTVALQLNCLGVVGALIKHGTDGNVQQPFIGNILRAETVARRTKAVQILLENGANVDGQGGLYDTALIAPSALGDLKVVQLLLEHGTNVNLQASAERGLDVSQLLKHGVDLSPQGGHYGTALQAASCRGSMEIARLLIKYRADVNLQGGFYGTALQAASEAGEEGIVRLLLASGADVNSQGGYFGTALQGASAEGHLDVVQLLLKDGANVDLQGGAYGTALQAASAEGKKYVVQVLLRNGANVNLQGGYCGTALQAASEYGRSAVVRLLLEHGADVNLQGGEYGTALQTASVEGHAEVARLLLEKGADVNLQGGYYGTALQAASCWGHMELVELLIEKGANVNLQGGCCGTALQAVSGTGRITFLRLLLEHGADVNIQGGLYGTALQAASVEGDLDVVQLLLENGADVKAQGGKYGTAHRAAISNGRIEVAKLLVAHGADTNLDSDMESC